MSRRRPVALVLAAAVLAAPVVLAAPAAALSEHASCADVAAADPSATDGEHEITVHGRTLTVWCADLATAPVEYLTLPAGGAENFGRQVADSQNWTGTTVVTRYSRVRLGLPATAAAPFTVDATDRRFATDSGSIAGPAGSTTSVDWGVGAACSHPWGDLLDGTGRADLTGTPFGISSDAFSTTGDHTRGSATQVSPRRVDTSGNGWCGATGPTTPTAVPLTWLAATGPYVTDHPDATTVASGSDVSFTVAAAGDATLTYAWEVSTDGGATWRTVAGASGTTLTLTGVTTADAGLVRAVVANAEGAVRSTAARLTVTGVAPAVTSGPSDVSTTAGSDAVFAVSVTGDPVPGVRWQRSQDGGTTWTDVTGATGTTLTLRAVAATDDGVLVRAVVTSTAGSVTSGTARLTVLAVPELPETGPVSPGLTALAVGLLAAGAGAVVVSRRASTR